MIDAHCTFPTLERGKSDSAALSFTFLSLLLHSFFLFVFLLCSGSAKSSVCYKWTPFTISMSQCTPVYSVKLLWFAKMIYLPGLYQQIKVKFIDACQCVCVSLYLLNSHRCLCQSLFGLCPLECCINHRYCTIWTGMCSLTHLSPFYLSQRSLDVTHCNRLR